MKTLLFDISPAIVLLKSEIVFTSILAAMILLVLVAVIFMIFRRSLKRVPRIILILLATFALVEIGIYIFVPQFPRRIQTGFTTNTAETSPSPEFPELMTRFYNAPPQQVFEASVNAIQGLPKWKLASRDETGGKIQAEREVIFNKVYIDDVTVTIREDGDRTRVDVHSKSREGKGDLGENRRHIADFLEALDERMQGAQG